MRIFVIHSMFRLIAVFALILIGNHSFASSLSSFDSDLNVYNTAENSPSSNSSVIDRYISSILLGYPVEKEEKEEKEEEEVNEEEARLKKVSVKDFFYKEINHCDRLRFLSEFESETDQVIYEFFADTEIVSCNYLLFQVFRI